MENTDSEEQNWWQAWVQNRDHGARQCIINHYLTLAQRIAGQLFAMHLPDGVEYEDYLQYANLGLIEAVDRYDPNNEAGFRTYAVYRIRGAILNGVSKTTETRHQLRYRQRVQRERLASLTEEQKKSHMTFENLVSFTAELAVAALLEHHPDNAAVHDPVLEGEFIKQIQANLSCYIDQLPDNEKKIIHYHYYAAMHFDQIADVLQLSKGRISQLHRRAIEKLKDRCTALSSLDELI